MLFNNVIFNLTNVDTYDGKPWSTFLYIPIRKNMEYLDLEYVINSFRFFAYPYELSNKYIKLFLKNISEKIKNVHNF